MKNGLALRQPVVHILGSGGNKSIYSSYHTQGGVWQDDGFELAEEKIIIQYDGGVGQFTVREVEVV